MRYDDYGPLDDPPQPNGDRGFIGVNMRLDPAQLPPGYVSEAINCRFRDGIASTRLGFTVVPWMNKCVGTATRPWGVVRGQGVFSDPFTLVEYLVIAADGAAYFTRSNNAPQALALPSGITLDAAVNFTQAFDVMICHRGETLSTLAMPRVTEGFSEVEQTIVPGEAHTAAFEWTGARDEVTVLNHGLPAGTTAETAQAVAVDTAGTLPAGLDASAVYYARVVDEDTLTLHNSPSGAGANTDRVTITDPGTGDHRMTWTTESETDGAVTIPNAERSIFFQNRLFIPVGDEVNVSDYGDYTRYLPVAQEFKVNAGSSDNLVAVFKFNDTTLVVFKEHSIYAVNNVYGNMAAIQQDEITNQFGLVAKKSIAHVGTDLWFLSELGVMSLTQTTQGKLQGVLLPVSDPIQPLIDRINWRYASNAVAAYWDNKYYLAVPLDDAEMLGPEIAPIGGGLFTPYVYTVPTATGGTYRWNADIYSTGITYGYIINGTETISASGEFVAQGSSVTVHNTVAIVQHSLRRVFRGHNNAVLVYDFLNGAWAGYDEAPGIDFKDLFLFTHNGRRRLFTTTTAGHVLLYEEDYEDQLPVPYTTLEVVGTPLVGSTIQVNGGDVITAGSQGPNTATLWSVAGSQNRAIRQLFTDAVTGEYGFSTNIGTGWVAPDTYPMVLFGGPFRPGFTFATTPRGLTFYATNGVVPHVETYDLVTEGPGGWAEIHEHGTQPIRTLLATRGYSAPRGLLQTTNWMVADIQTWAPTTSITAIASGVEEETEILTDQTRDRTLYYKANMDPFSLDNVNGDFLAPKRQDYSVLLGDPAPAGAATQIYLHTTEGGVPLDRHQEVRVTERVGERCRSLLLEFENTTGRLRVMSAGVESDERPLVPATEA